MPADEEEKETSLIVHPAQQISIRASLVTRGLREAIQLHTPAVAWSRPSLIGTITDPSESPDHTDPGNKFVHFVCHLENITDFPQTLCEGVGVLRRSRTTGEISSLSRDGFGFPASRIVVPTKEVSPPILLGLSFRKDKSLGGCLKQLFDESCELLAYDEKFRTVINIGLDYPSLLGLPLSQDKERLRILEVDDEEPVRAILRAWLTSAGYACTSVPSGVDALALLESGEEFDLLLNDLMNASMDGITLLERVHEGLPNLPVIMVTAVHDIEVALAALERGASDYLLKPFTREQLLVIVRQVLACRNQPKRKIIPWARGLSTLIASAVKDQNVVQTMDGPPKLIFDLRPGDIVPVEHASGVQMLHLVERDGNLAAIDFAQIK